jgi:hypothetical protein
MAPPVHPYKGNTTVLSGTVSVGSGETFDVAMPPGAVVVVP